MKRYILLAAMAVILGLTGCGARRVGIYATVAPPPLRVEAYGPSPGPGHLWIRGYWGWNNGGHVWVPGRWDRIPSGRRRWNDGAWVRRGNRYHWRDGRWR